VPQNPSKSISAGASSHTTLNNNNNNNNNNNTIYIEPIKSEYTEALGGAGLSLTKQLCL